MGLATSSGYSETFEARTSDIVLAIEAIGIVVMVVGGAGALLIGLVQAWRSRTRASAYETTRRNLGRAILLGLEVLIIADIVRTVVVDSTLESVVVLGAIVIIRIILSFSLEVEMNGTWPWSMRRLGQRPSPDDP